MRLNHQETKACISAVFTFSDHAYLSLREPKRSTFPLSLSTFSSSPLWTLYPYGDHEADAGIFLEGQYFAPSKTRCFGQITISLPSSSNKSTRESISSLSEATHDCVVCNSLKCAFTSLTQEFKGKNCVRSGYLVDTSHSLVQRTAKEHENCDIVFNERPFHLYILYL